MIENVALILRHGAYVETACAFVNISVSTFYRWMHRGEEGMELFARLEIGEELSEAGANREDFRLYVEFWEAVAEARAIATVRDLLVISAAAQAGDWRASAWRLERRFTGQWSRRAEDGALDEFHPPEEGDASPKSMKIVVTGPRPLTKEEFLHGVVDGRVRSTVDD